MMTGQGRTGFSGLCPGLELLSESCEHLLSDDAEHLCLSVSLSVCLSVCLSVNPSYQISHMMQNIPMTGDNAKYTTGHNPPTCSFHIEKIF